MSVCSDLLNIICNYQQPNINIIGINFHEACDVCGQEKFRTQHTLSRGHQFICAGLKCFALDMIMYSEWFSGKFYVSLESKISKDIDSLKRNIIAELYNERELTLTPNLLESREWIRLKLSHRLCVKFSNQIRELKI